MDNGNGFGDGYGEGLWLKRGAGYGTGHGSGYGYGTGHGAGFGDESGVPVGKVGVYAVYLLFPWPYIQAGCQTLHIDTWEAQWQSLAEEYNVNVSKETVNELLAKCRAVLKGQDR